MLLVFALESEKGRVVDHTNARLGHPLCAEMSQEVPNRGGIISMQTHLSPAALEKRVNDMLVQIGDAISAVDHPAIELFQKAQFRSHGRYGIPEACETVSERVHVRPDHTRPEAPNPGLVLDEVIQHVSSLSGQMAVQEKTAGLCRLASPHRGPYPGRFGLTSSAIRHKTGVGMTPEVVRDAARTAGGHAGLPPRLVEPALRDPLAGLLPRRVAENVASDGALLALQPLRHRVLAFEDPS